MQKPILRSLVTLYQTIVLCKMCMLCKNFIFYEIAFNITPVSIVHLQYINICTYPCICIYTCTCTYVNIIFHEKAF